MTLPNKTKLRQTSSAKHQLRLNNSALVEGAQTLTNLYSRMQVANQILQNEADIAEQAKHALKISCSAKGEAPETGPPKVQFQGYSGDSVDLSDYGFDAPVVYDVAKIEMKQKIPILFEHYKAIGHTTQLKKPENSQLTGKGLLSLPNEKTTEITAGLKNGFPFEGSMGLVVKDWENDITFYKKGETVKVNNRVFNGPVYVVNKSRLVEMTLTPFGRDGNTSFEFLNEAKRMILKNSKTPAPKTEGEAGGATTLENNAGSAGAGTVAPNVTLTQEQFKELLNGLGSSRTQNSTDPEDEEEEETGGEGGSALKNSAKEVLRLHKLCQQYPEHIELVEKALDEGWDDNRLKNEVNLNRLEKGYGPLPQGNQQEQAVTVKNMVSARMMLSLGSKPESIEKKFGKEIANKAVDMPMISIPEVLVHVANSCGGNFNSWSDMDAVCKHIKNFNKLNNSIGFSTLTYSNLLENVAQTQLEERWQLDPPFAPRFLQESSNKDFRKTRKVRVSGGDPWERLEPDGTIKHTSFGPENYYESELDTVAALFTWDRKTIINDDQDVTRDLMDAMVEGAMMVPDIKLGQKMLVQASAANSFWVDGDNSITGAALTDANLSIQYKDLLTYDEQRGTVSWRNIVGGRWTLILDPAMEETAFNLFKQDWIVGNTTANTKQGSRNFWYNKFDMEFFPQMSNTGLFGSGTFVSPNTWIIWPQQKKYSPYLITYLKGRKRPTIEAIDLPDNILGAGVRGYWDVEINERERQFIKRING